MGSQAWADGRTKTNVAPKNIHTLFFLVVGDYIRPCLVPTVAPKIFVTSIVSTHALSIKYRLITKLIAQLATNLRGESFKPN